MRTVIAVNNLYKPQLGDWVFYGFELAQVRRIEKDGMVEISDGSFSTSGDFAKELVPLTRDNKSRADTIKYYMDSLHKDRGSFLLNFPDIHGKFTNFAILANTVSPIEEVNNMMVAARKFYSDICNARDEAVGKTVGGIKVFNVR